MHEPPIDLPRAHHWFAVEFNNEAWRLIEAERRSAEEVERLIHLAHASTLHWLEAGGPVNHLRGQVLLATAYAAAGDGAAAVRHAERCLTLSQQVGDEQTAFDRATAHGCAANAYALVDRPDEARMQHELARQAAARFDHPSETEVFEKLYPAP